MAETPRSFCIVSDQEPADEPVIGILLGTTLRDLRFASTGGVNKGTKVSCQRSYPDDSAHITSLGSDYPC